MIELSTIAYLLIALFRSDWSLYEFDEPIVMWVEPRIYYLTEEHKSKLLKILQG